jgi:predicted DNA-binding transcriptional regulator YafY
MLERETVGSRLLGIIVYIHQREIVDRETLAEKFGITQRTIYRDLNWLAPIVLKGEDGRYRLSAPCKNVMDKALSTNTSDA